MFEEAGRAQSMYLNYEVVVPGKFGRGRGKTRKMRRHAEELCPRARSMVGASDAVLCASAEENACIQNRLLHVIRVFLSTGAENRRASASPSGIRSASSIWPAQISVNPRPNSSKCNKQFPTSESRIKGLSSLSPYFLTRRAYIRGEAVPDPSAVELP